MRGLATISEKWIIGSIVLLLCYTSWVCGGAHSGYQAPMPWLAALALFVLILSPALERIYQNSRIRGQEVEADKTLRVSWSVRQMLVSLLKDPIFYTGLCFLALLFVQWWNSERTLLFNYDKHQWIYSTPHVAWLPSAVKAEEAKEMLVWFFPAFSIILCVRHGLRSRNSVHLLFLLMVLNASVLAVFGIIQFLSGTSAMYWRYPLPGHFFASFGYPNHAGMFFVLMLCLSIGLFVRELVYHHKALVLGPQTDDSPPAQRRMHAVTGACRKLILSQKRLMLPVSAVILALISANLSLSRWAIMVSWLSVAVAGVYTVAVAFRYISPARRVSLITALLAITILAGFAVDWSAHDSLRSELATLADHNKFVKDVNARGWQITAAVRIWKDHPWFGIGGWGYRYFAAMYLDPAQWDLLLPTGHANVHNDLAQFLAEFGAVGLALLVATVIIVSWPLMRVRWRQHGLLFFAILGAGFTCAHSMIDLPFRCPAILFTWLAIMTGCAQYVRLEKQQPAING